MTVACACVHMLGMTNTQETTMTQDTATGWICTDCMMLLANGEAPPEMSEEETAAWLASIDDETEMTPGLLAEEHDEDCPNHGGWQGVECSCERQEFSWSACDSCGSHLGGERHAVTFWL